MNNILFPTFNGVFCVANKKSVFGYVNERAFHIQESHKNKLLPIYHNKIIFLRGMEYLIFGFVLFFRGLIISLEKDKSSFKYSKLFGEKLNVSYIGIFGGILCFISIIFAFLLFGILPEIFSLWFIKINQNIILRNLIIGLLKSVIFIGVFYLLKYTYFNKLFIFNYACSCVQNEKDNLPNTKNFVNFLIIGFILSLFMITFLSIETSPVFKLLYNLTIFFIVFSVLYEILNFVDKGKNKTLKKILYFLCASNKNSTALLVARSAYWECKMIEDNTEEKKLSTVIAYVQNKLIENQITDEMEAKWLVSGALKINLNELLFTPSISSVEEQNIKKVLARRIKGEPLDKIFGEKEFFGLVFKVNTSVLSPRYETEILVEKVIQHVKQKKCDILDLCTGSGCIAISVKKNVGANVFASDISESALKVAKENAKLNGVGVKFIKSDMFNDLKSNQKYDIIVSNPPYIQKSDIEKLDREVKNYDPRLALDGGEDGLDFYREIAHKSHQFLKNDGMLFLEIGIGQAQSVKKLLKKDFCDIQVIKDYNQIERIIIARKRKNVRQN